LLSCASCGIRDYTLRYHPRDLKTLSFLIVPSDEVENFGKFQGLHRARSVYFDPQSNNYYRLHPELVDTEKHNAQSVKNCHAAIQQKWNPPYSLIAGFDFGDIKRLIGHCHLNLKPLGFIEKHLVSLVRPLGSIFKFTSNPKSQKSLMAYILTFLHDGPEKATKVIQSLPHKDCSVVVAFVGTREEFEIPRKDAVIATRDLQVNATNVFNWLLVYSQLNEQYQGIKLTLNDEVAREIEQIPAMRRKLSMMLIPKSWSHDLAQVRESSTESPASVFLTNWRDIYGKAGDPQAVTGRMIDVIKSSFFPDLETPDSTNPNPADANNLSGPAINLDNKPLEAHQPSPPPPPIAEN